MKFFLKIKAQVEKFDMERDKVLLESKQHNEDADKVYASQSEDIAKNDDTKPIHNLALRCAFKNSEI